MHINKQLRKEAKAPCTVLGRRQATASNCQEFVWRVSSNHSEMEGLHLLQLILTWGLSNLQENFIVAAYYNVSVL